MKDAAQSPEPLATSERPRFRWVALLGATAAQLGISFLEQGIAALVPYVKADYHLSSAMAGVFGTSANIGRALAGMLAIRPVDRYGERRLILAGSAASGVLAIAAAGAPTPAVTLVLLLLSGMAQTVALLAGITAIARWFRSGGRGIAMGVRQAAVPLGGTLAAASLPPLALAIGWRGALMIAGGLCIAAAVAGTLIYRDLDEPATRAVERPALREAVVAVLRDPDVAKTVLAATVLAASQFVTLTYIQLFLVEELGLSLQLAAVVLTVTLVAGIAGRLAWGAVSDLVFDGRRRGVLVSILLLAGLGSAGMAFAGPSTGLSLALPLALLLGFTTVGSPGVYLALIADLAPVSYGSVTMGVGITCIQASALVVPPIFGVLVDATDSYRVSWLTVAAMLLVTVPILRSIRRS